MRPRTRIKEIDEQEEQPDPVLHRSEIAGQLENLRKATLNAAKKREHLPQPLFWSLFMSEVAQIKRKKRQQAVLEAIFGAPLKNSEPESE